MLKTTAIVMFATAVCAQFQDETTTEAPEVAPISATFAVSGTSNDVDLDAITSTIGEIFDWDSTEALDRIEVLSRADNTMLIVVYFTAGSDTATILSKASSFTGMIGGLSVVSIGDVAEDRNGPDTLEFICHQECFCRTLDCGFPNSKKGKKGYSDSRSPSSGSKKGKKGKKGRRGSQSATALQNPGIIASATAGSVLIIGGVVLAVNRVRRSSGYNIVAGHEVLDVPTEQTALISAKVSQIV